MSLNPTYFLTNVSDEDKIKFKEEFNGYCSALEAGNTVYDAKRFYSLYNTLTGYRKEYTGSCNSCLKRMINEFRDWEKDNTVELPPAPVIEKRKVVLKNAKDGK